MKLNEQKIILEFVKALLKEDEEANGAAAKPQLMQNGSLDDALDKYLIKAEHPSDLEKQEDKAEGSDEEQKPVPKKSLDINHFAKTTARLYENYESLIDIPTIILRRAINYVKSNYDDATAKELEETLSKEYNVELVKKDLDFDIQAPYADRAGPGLAGT